LKKLEVLKHQKQLKIKELSSELSRDLSREEISIHDFPVED